MDPVSASRSAAARTGRGGLLPWLLGWLVATSAVLAFHARPAHTPLDVDEFYWIGSAYYYHLAFERGDWRHPDWQLLPARENPPVSKYVLGLGLTLGGQSVAAPDLLGAFYLIFQGVPHAWGEGEAYAKRNAVVERMRPELRNRLRSGAQLQLDPKLRLAGRRTILVCLIVTSLLVFFLGARLVHPLAGLAASVMLGAHPALVQSYNLAHSDIVALLFSTAAAWATFVLAQRIRQENQPVCAKDFLLAGAAGLLLALACGAKMNALVVFGLAGAAVALALGQRGWRERRFNVPALLAGLTVAATALVVFIGINPAITNDLAGGLAATVKEHRATELIQARFMREHLTTLPAKFAAVGQLTTGSSPLLIVLAIAAAVIVARTRHEGLRFAALWFLIGLAAVTLWIPFPIGRYVLPVVLPGIVLVACLVGAGVSRIQSRWRNG